MNGINLNGKKIDGLVMEVQSVKHYKILIETPIKTCIFGSDPNNIRMTLHDEIVSKFFKSAMI